ncbi:MAG TPA: hypothetical protein VGP13_01155, partial [Candidatus Paceibacterota bacterium]|nr:hypothetical protein [Candidatus Paceibacterota bacterium]
MRQADWLEFFFEAMSGAESYAGGGEAQPIPDRPGWKGFDVSRDGFRLIDQYTGTGAGLLTGHTTLWAGDKTMLFVSYGGHYPDDATDALREILGITYQERSFIGGRGRDGLRAKGFVYYNQSQKLTSLIPN